jgi:hypothetical protein
MSEVAIATPAAPAAATPTPAAAPASLLAGGTPPAAATPAATSTTPVRFFGDNVAKDGQFKEGWTENLQKMGFERLANKAALAKDEATFFKTMDETLGLVGKKAGIAYPKAGADEAAITAFRADAGVPESWEGYNLKPAELPPGIDWSDDTAVAYAKALHAHHVPAAAAQELVNLHIQQLTAQTQAAQQNYQAAISNQVQETEQTFQKEWGSEYESRLEANRAFVQSQFTAEELQQPVLVSALSHPSIVRIIDQARQALREPSTIPGLGMEAGSGTHSPRQQALEIIKANPQWERDPALHKRVTDLYALDHAQQKRTSRK